MKKLFASFIWSSLGKILLVSLDDIKLPYSKGGLSLTCIHTMSNSLQLSNVLKLLKNGDDKAFGHIWFWISECIADFFPGKSVIQQGSKVPGYFLSLALLVTDARLTGIISETNWRLVNNKLIYRKHPNWLIPVKIERDIGISLDNSWANLNKIPYGSRRHEITYLLVHNKLPTKERLFHIGIEQEPYCSYCLDELGMAMVSDLQHFFCCCGRVASIWNGIKTCLENLLHVPSLPLKDLDLISLNFSHQSNAREIIWLISWYVSEIWYMSRGKNSEHLSRGKFFGFLQFKYKNDFKKGLVGDIPEMC